MGFLHKMGFTETSVVKYIVFSFNLLFVITGVTILAIGLTIKAAYHDYSSFLDDGYFSTPALLVAVGDIVFIIAFFGCCGAIKENSCMLLTFAALLVIVFILEISAGISGFVLQGRTVEVLTSSLRSTMNTYNDPGHNATTDLWDIMQGKLTCCGINGPADWAEALSKKTNTTDSLPISCCPIVRGITGTMHCTTSNTTSTPPYHGGCLPALGSVVEGHMGSVGAAALSVCLVQILAVFLSIRLAKTLRNFKSTTLT